MQEIIGPGGAGEPFAETHKHGLRRTAILHLLPGVPSLIGYAFFAAIVGTMGLPNVFALYLTIPLIEVPVTWFIMIQATKAEGRPITLAGLFPNWRPVRWWMYGVIGVPLLIFSLVMIGGVTPRLSAVIQSSLFTWVPEWFALEMDPMGLLDTPMGVRYLMAILGFFGVAIVGGFTQEVYFRGFLLPRMADGIGVWAPALNALLFAVFHLASPWSWPGFFLMVLPWAYVVYWTRSVKLGLFAHMGMLLLSAIGMSMLLLGLIDASAFAP